MSRKFVATVKETGSGQPYVVIEAHEDNGLADNQSIVFDLKTGTDVKEADALARFMNDCPHGLEAIRVAKF